MTITKNKKWNLSYESTFPEGSSKVSLGVDKKVIEKTVQNKVRQKIRTRTKKQD